MSIGELLEEGIIGPGLQLKYAHLGPTHTAEITSQGTILYNEEHYSSASAAERAAIGYPTGNAWLFWWYRDQDSGEWWPLARLRAKLSGYERR